MTEKLALAMALTAAMIAACAGATSTVHPPSPLAATPGARSAPPADSASLSSQPFNGPTLGPTAIAGGVVGTIHRGWEICTGLAPLRSSPIQPADGLRWFELWLPEGYRIEEHDIDPRPDVHENDGRFRIFDRDGRLFADEHDVIEAVGDIPESWGSHCMFGQPLHASEVRLIQAVP